MPEEDHILQEAMDLYWRLYDDGDNWLSHEDCLRQAIKYALDTLYGEMY